MIGAVLTHLFIVGENPAIPLMLLIITVTIAWMRRSTMMSPWAARLPAPLR